MKPDLARIWIWVASDSYSDTDPCLKESETESLENDEDNEENLEEDEDSNESDPQSFWYLKINSIKSKSSRSR